MLWIGTCKLVFRSVPSQTHFWDMSYVHHWEPHTIYEIKQFEKRCSFYRVISALGFVPLTMISRSYNKLSSSQVYVIYIMLGVNTYRLFSTWSYTNDQILYNQFNPYFLCRVSWLPIITNLGSLSQIRLNEYQLKSISFNYNICGIWKIFNNTKQRKYGLPCIM